MKSLADFLFTLGLLLVIASSLLFWQRNTPSRLSFEVEKLPDSYREVVYDSNKSNDNYIIIEELGINLPIIESRIIDNKWQATTEGVSHLVNSPHPGSIGNSIIYGHNWGSLLGNLVHARPGQEVKVVIAGEIKVYKIKYVQEVTPDDVSILKNTDDIRITLYTCSGFFDSKRLVVTAVAV